MHLFAKMIERNKHIKAFFRPFSTIESKVISPHNKIVGAYIYDWDNNVSENNLLINAQVDIPCEETEDDTINNTNNDIKGLSNESLNASQKHI